MNLVISGPIDATLRNMVVALSKPRRVVPLHSRADRMEGVDDAPVARMQVSALCDAARVDHAYIEEGIRFADFKLLAMDMDSTLITIECIDEIADYAGKKKEVAEITERAMRGELDFAESLRQRVRLLVGTNQNVLDTVINERLALMPGAAKFIKDAQILGISTIILSGGFTYFSDHLKSLLKIDAAFANTLEIRDGSLTGLLAGEIVDGTRKATHLEKAKQLMICSASQTLVIGDGANDIPMMKCASNSIAYYAKPIARQFATAAINFGTWATIVDYF